ncbi:hypothetical protein [Planktothricoides raciborskii]|uniref:Uncharacterized protein n=1 Tax=Planktothricoides raciborskii GIHE-MW2 TaxID=2792601 RepID=A0AAU8JHI3_9CYAN
MTDNHQLNCLPEEVTEGLTPQQIEQVTMIAVYNYEAALKYAELIKTEKYQKKLKRIGHYGMDPLILDSFAKGVLQRLQNYTPDVTQCCCCEDKVPKGQKFCSVECSDLTDKILSGKQTQVRFPFAKKTDYWRRKVGRQALPYSVEIKSENLPFNEFSD